MRSYYCSIIYTSFQSTGPLNPALKGASMAIWEALFSFSHHAAWLFVVFRGQDSAVVRCYSKSRHSPSVGKKIAASQRRRIHHIFGETRSCFWNSSDTGQNMYVFSEECLFNEYRQLQSYQPINIGIYRFFLYIWVYLLVNKSSYFSVITERQSCLSAKITDNRTLGETLPVIHWL